MLHGKLTTLQSPFLEQGLGAQGLVGVVVLWVVGGSVAAVELVSCSVDVVSEVDSSVVCVVEVDCDVDDSVADVFGGSVAGAVVTDVVSGVQSMVVVSVVWGNVDVGSVADVV